MYIGARQMTMMMMTMMMMTKALFTLAELVRRRNRTDNVADICCRHTQWRRKTTSRSAGRLTPWPKISHYPRNEKPYELQTW